MPFERQSLKGPKGLVIQGPEEHVGESRYHWIEETRKMGRFVTIPEQMALRIEKMNGTNKEYDCHSPIVSCCFAVNGLHIALWPLSKLPYKEFRQIINPYSNAVASYTPGFIIAEKHFRHSVYSLQYETNAWGDFLMLEQEIPGENEYPKEERWPHQILMLNLWAIFGMEGLHEIRSDGSLYFYGDQFVGQAPTVGGECLPFFADVTPTKSGYRERHRIFEDFQRRSSVGALMMVQVRIGEPSADTFATIAETTYGDRPSTTPERALSWAKETVQKLFPGTK